MASSSNIEHAKTHGKARSPEWEAFKRQYAKKVPKICENCGGKTKVELHHIIPFHIWPEGELNENNVMWLCEGKKTLNCHLIMGHFDNFKNKFNPNVRQDVALWNARLTNEYEAQAFPNYQRKLPKGVKI